MVLALSAPRPKVVLDHRWSPLRVTGTSLPPGWLATAKGIAFLLVTLEYGAYLGKPFLPFVPGIDSLPADVWRTALVSSFVTGLLLLFSNLAVRTGSLLVGGAFLANLLADRTDYLNSTVWAAMVLVLVGLYTDDRSRATMRIQFSLLYTGAFLGKLLDADWHDGTFIADWRFDGAGLYDSVSATVGETVLAVSVSWIVMIVEAVLAVLFLRRRTAPSAALLAAGFHTMPVLVNGLTFGIFYPALALSLVTLVDAPPVERFDLRRGWRDPVLPLILVIGYGSARVAKHLVLG